MKHIKLIALAVSIMALSSGNAVAEELEVKSPEISSKLNMMVEDKMDRLVKKIYEPREHVQVAEPVNNDLTLIPRSSGKVTTDVSKEIGS